MLYVPADGVDAWKRLLAHPDKQWATGYSARTLAHCWQSSEGDFPPSVRSALDSSQVLQGAQFLAGFIEHLVQLPPTGRRASQNDLFVFARSSAGHLISIAVEGKVDEPFGPLVHEWRDGSAGKEERLTYLRELLGLSEQAVMPLRYQLLHRAGSALIEGRRWDAQHSVMLVHSFSAANAWFEDYAAFGRSLGVQSEPGTISPVGERGARQFLHIGWVRGEAEFLSA